MVKGTIVLTILPFTDLSSTKRRPALVVSAKESLQGDVIVAFISSVVPHKLTSVDYLISTSHSDFAISGLIKDSVLKADKLATLNKSVFSGILGNLSQPTLQDIDNCLKSALNIV
jgi:mRNA interferase MazF